MYSCRALREAILPNQLSRYTRFRAEPGQSSYSPAEDAVHDLHAPVNYTTNANTCQGIPVTRTLKGRQSHCVTYPFGWANLPQRLAGVKMGENVHQPLNDCQAVQQLTGLSFSAIIAPAQEVYADDR